MLRFDRDGTAPGGGRARWPVTVMLLDALGRDVADEWTQVGGRRRRPRNRSADNIWGGIFCRIIFITKKYYICHEPRTKDGSTIEVGRLLSKASNSALLFAKSTEPSCLFFIEHHH